MWHWRKPTRQQSTPSITQYAAMQWLEGGDSLTVVSDTAMAEDRGQ
jgi:hypothetical protein